MRIYFYAALQWIGINVIKRNVYLPGYLGK